MFGYIILGVVALIVALLAVCLIRTLLCKTPADAKLTLEDLTTKGVNSVGNVIKGPLTSRPLNKFFED